MIRYVLTSMIAGDALGSAVDGMTRGHIRAHFRSITGYIDPEPALKNRLESWRKPGLYSSISQMMLMLAMSCPRRGACAESFRRAVASSPEVAGYDYGIFRYPGAVERAFILAMKDPRQNRQTTEQPCARVIPVMTFLSFRNNSGADQILDVTAAVRLFTLDCSTLACALIYSSLLMGLASGALSLDRTVQASAEAAAGVADAVDDNSSAIFAGGVNPGTLIGELRSAIDLLGEMASAATIGAAEEIIVSHVNRKLKTPVTRATVNLPSALFPYALAVSAFAGAAGTAPAPAAAVYEGGSTAALAAMAGALGAAQGGRLRQDDPLVQNLVNRKKVLALVDALSAGTASPGPEALDDFIRSEASLTGKEQEELKARLRHTKKKQRSGPLTRAEKEKELARHVVESWTKYDRARWKKERQRHDKNDES